LKLKAEFFFQYGTRSEVKSIDKAISPDNNVVPPGLEVKTKRCGCILKTSVFCERTLNTFLSTLDDLLACISVAEKTFQVLQPSEKRTYDNS